MRTTAFLALALLTSSVTLADEESADVDEPTPPTITEDTAKGRNDEAALKEDPEQQRRTRNKIEEEVTRSSGLLPGPESDFSAEFYISLRAVAIHGRDESGERETRLSDGYSRAGMRLGWEGDSDWEFYGRAEYGIDVVDNFATRGGFDQAGGPVRRVLAVGVDSEHFAASYGKNWGVYYEVSGMTDRFALFGGSAAGNYNAGTDGYATGTGRGNDVFQGRIYIQPPRWLGTIKPFNLNVQYQLGQDIPRAESLQYDHGYAVSTWIETENEIGLGLAYNQAEIGSSDQPELQAVGLDGDSTAFAASTRWYGEGWYISTVYTRLKNMEVTNLGRYFDGRGLEIYGQYEFRDNWWLIGGGNWLQPDKSEVEAGEYEVDYYVLGGRYTFESFDRMVFFEYKHNNSRLVDGTEGDNEVVIGFRWGWGY